MNTKIFFIILTTFIYISFFFGFLTEEDAAGGGKIDIQHIYQNISLFKNSNLLDIEWNLYESTSLPLYYLILKYFLQPLQLNLTLLRTNLSACERNLFTFLIKV